MQHQLRVIHRVAPAGFHMSHAAAAFVDAFTPQQCVIPHFFNWAFIVVRHGHAQTDGALERLVALQHLTCFDIYRDDVFLKWPALVVIVAVAIQIAAGGFGAIGKMDACGAAAAHKFSVGVELIKRM